MSKLNRAHRNYAMWHQKNPSEVLTPKYEFYKEAFKIGRIEQLWYSSDKWEDDGDFKTYYHDFDSKPPIYVAECSPLITPANESLPTAKTSRLLGVSNVDGTVPLTLLSYAIELTINYGKHKKRFKFRSEQPPVCGTPDNKTLVILSRDGPIFVRGGKMCITARGIVN